MLDFATLTGACMVALGPHTAGVMSNDDALAQRWLAAAERAGEEMWRLPLPPRLARAAEVRRSPTCKNTGERWGGALTAGLFLKEFVGDTPWVHVDIAGPSSASKEHGHVAQGRNRLRASRQSSSTCAAPQPEPRQIARAQPRQSASKLREHGSNAVERCVDSGHPA